MHGIVHVSFPDFNEEQTNNKSFDWSNRNMGAKCVEELHVRTHSMGQKTENECNQGALTGFT
jgi:hypothetical protein